MSDWIVKGFWKKGVFHWNWVIFAFKPNIIVLMVSTSIGKRNSKPLSLGDLSLWNDVILEHHGRLDDK